MRPRIFGMVSTVLSTEYTWWALKSFFQHTPLREEDRFLLIDNDAGSLSAERIRNEYPRVELIAIPEPRGFAKNMNDVLRAADQARGDAFLLNNDIIFSPDWLDSMLIDQPWVVSACCNMQFPHQLNGLELKLSMNLEDYLGRENDFLEIVRAHRETQGGYRVVHSVPYYCVKIPPAVYDHVGLLDESFGEACWEDVDYILRCWERGFPLFFALSAFIIHFYGKSTWRAEIPDELKHREPSKTRVGEFAFRKRWGEDIAQAYGFQSQEGMRRLRGAEQVALAQCYSKFVRDRKPNPKE